jgi:hypothetical protein
MNDKFLEILSKSSGRTITRPYDGSLLIKLDLSELEKFAELIVRECLSLSSGLYPSYAMDAAGLGAKSQYGSAALLRVYENTNDQYYDAIKKHFGVDEK